MCGATLVVDIALARLATSSNSVSCVSGSDTHGPPRSLSSSTASSEHLNAQNTNAVIEPPSPPFDLIAEVYIDGRTTAEIRSIVCLNLYDPYHSKDGVILKGRRVRGTSTTDGQFKVCFHDWVFTDIGIEVLLERMGVQDTPESNSKDDQEITGLADMLQDTVKVDNEEEELKIGRIEVVFTRVVLGSLITSTAISKILHDAEENHAVPQKGIGKDVTHTTR